MLGRTIRQVSALGAIASVCRTQIRHSSAEPSSQLRQSSCIWPLRARLGSGVHTCKTSNRQGTRPAPVWHPSVVRDIRAPSMSRSRAVYPWRFTCLPAGAQRRGKPRPRCSGQRLGISGMLSSFSEDDGAHRPYPSKTTVMSAALDAPWSRPGPTACTLSIFTPPPSQKLPPSDPHRMTASLGFAGRWRQGSEKCRSGLGSSYAKASRLLEASLSQPRSYWPNSRKRWRQHPPFPVSAPSQVISVSLSVYLLSPRRHHPLFLLSNIRFLSIEH